MSSIEPQKLFTLKQAASELGVSVEVLLSWNEHNILKPTITKEGEIVYTQEQIDQFAQIRNTSFSANSSVPADELTAEHLTNSYPLEPVVPAAPQVTPEPEAQ